MPDLNTLIVPYGDRRYGGKTDLRNKLRDVPRLRNAKGKAYANGNRDEEWEVRDEG
jgi:hypothetical protein